MDEWSGAQLYAVLLLPVYSLYRSLVGSSEGVFLFFRLLMVVCNYFLSLYIFAVIQKRYSNAAAIAGALLFLLYTRANIQGASYYSVSLFLFLWAVCLLYNYKSGKNNWIRLFAAGCAVALAALGNPYVAIFYVIYGIAVIFIGKYRRWIRQYAIVCAGTLFSVCCYMAFILSRVSLRELSEYLPYIFKDPEHESVNIIILLILWLARIIYRYIYTIPFIVLLIAVLLWNGQKRGNIDARLIKSGICLSFLIFAVNYYLSHDMIGCINIALSILTFFFFLIVPKQKRKDLEREFQVFVLPGIIYSIAWHMISNTGLDSMTIGFTVCAVIAPAAIQEAYLELESDSCRKHSWLRLLPLAVAAAAILQTGCLRLLSVYRDDEIWKMDTRIDRGPAKYLYTTGEHYRQYDEIVQILTAAYADGREGTLVITELVPWAYLCVDVPYGSPSPCRFSGGLSEERLKSYYELQPDRMPAFIMAVKPEYGNYKSYLIQGNEEVAAPNGTGVAGWLLESAEEMGYIIEDTMCGTVYYRG